MPANGGSDVIQSFNFLCRDLTSHVQNRPSAVPLDCRGAAASSWGVVPTPSKEENVLTFHSSADKLPATADRSVCLG